MTTKYEDALASTEEDIKGLESAISKHTKESKGDTFKLQPLLTYLERTLKIEETIKALPRIIKNSSSFKRKDAPINAMGILVTTKGRKSFNLAWTCLKYRKVLPDTTTKLQTSAMERIAKKLTRKRVKRAK